MNDDSQSFMDENNFQYETGNWYILMRHGELIINEVSYERNEDDPTYDFVIELAYLKGIITK